MNLHWFIEYLGIAFHCLSPILHAVWITGDRLGAEFAFLIPKLNYQLLQWGYALRVTMSGPRWKLKDKKSQEMATGVSIRGESWRGVRMTYSKQMSHITDFKCYLDYPVNRYTIFGPDWYAETDMSREGWFLCMLQVPKPSGYSLSGETLNQRQSSDKINAYE